MTQQNRNIRCLLFVFLLRFLSSFLHSFFSIVMLFDVLCEVTNINHTSCWYPPLLVSFLLFLLCPPVALHSHNLSFHEKSRSGCAGSGLKSASDNLIFWLITDIGACFSCVLVVTSKLNTNINLRISGATKISSCSLASVI